MGRINVNKERQQPVAFELERWNQKGRVVKKVRDFCFVVDAKSFWSG
jgi:hypothetical protein